MEFRDLKKQYEVLKPEIDAAVTGVIDSAQFISGLQVKELEQELTDYVGVKHCITCANGTDAITLALKVWQIGAGDAVFVPDFTFFSSGECPAAEGATCIFVDVKKDTFNMDPQKLDHAIRQIKAEGKLRPRVVVAVDLFGQPADYDEIRLICEKYGLLLLEDAAQSFGGSLHGKMCGSFGDISTTSFFPAKPLGCYGDGGAMFTDKDEWASMIRSLAVHGKSGEDKYDNVRLGMNSRLDTIQAAILKVKLEAFRRYEVQAANSVAKWYEKELAGSGLYLPRVPQGMVSSWAQYTVRLPKKTDRAGLIVGLKRAGIPAMVYYAKPMHLQGAFIGTRSAVVECPIAAELCETVLSLPMGPYMKKEQVEEIARQLCNCLDSL